MEKPSTTSLFLNTTKLTWAFKTLHKLFPTYLSHLQSYTNLFTTTFMAPNDHNATNQPFHALQHGHESENGHEDPNKLITREDVEMIMGRMGMRLGGGDDEPATGVDDLSGLFAEKEPSLEEVREAFSVFDENSDGFIDAKELQRVLSRLGFAEGVDLHACKRMIDAYDVNNDGRIDLIEFVKFLDGSFC
ncbi:putative calcium-binding protein [Ananas comosus]|uniref:Putative calcium-binding protein n=1 Tax=Ananas comosus TaxID=4615 RepID=A0A199VZV2_ANACO|nr:putative calcium-binding protein [Ananas comosus]